MSFRQNNVKKEYEPTTFQFNCEGDNVKIMMMAGYKIKGFKKNGFIREVGQRGARFHAYVYPELIYLHYDDMHGYKHQTHPHPQLLKGEANRIKSFEDKVNKYIKKNRKEKK